MNEMSYTQPNFLRIYMKIKYGIPHFRPNRLLGFAIHDVILLKKFGTRK